MKTIYLTLLTFLAFNYLNAQTPDYFADNPEWLQSSSCNWTGCIENKDFVYFLDGDSVLNNITYHKVYIHGKMTPFPMGQGQPCPPEFTFYNFVTLLRQDSLRIYEYNAIEATDTLLYDFNLNIGDTLPRTNNLWSTTSVVDSVDTVIINGTNRKKFYISGPDMVAYEMIEGIGANTGLLEQMDQLLDCGYGLSCFKVNGTIEIGSGCNFEVSLNELDLLPKVMLYPNPVDDFVRISSESNHLIRSIQILKTDGSVTNEFLFDGSIDEIEIPIEFLERGFYFLRLNYVNDQYLSKKFLKS